MGRNAKMVRYTQYVHPSLPNMGEVNWVNALNITHLTQSEDGQMTIIHLLNKEYLVSSTPIEELVARINADD